MINPRPVKVYIACPYTADNKSGVRRSAFAAARLMWVGFATYVPNLNHYIEAELQAYDSYEEMYRKAVEACDPAELYEFWLSNDFAFLDECDVLLRLSGYSPGAVQEDIRFRLAGKPVFYDLEELWKLGPKAFYEDSQV